MFLFILPIILVTLFSLGVIVFMLNFTSPQTKEGSVIIINLVYFFVSGFVSLAGAITLVLYWLGNWQLKRSRSEVESVHKPRILLKKSLRHGVLVAGTLTGIGLLNALELTNPLNIILLISAAILIEVYFFGH
ncbi:MAG TPA: hypothetical protein VIH52_04605 [Candidatus Nanoarchaeia archaeon]